MTKLEVTQEREIFIYNFTLADGTKKQQKYSKTTHEAIKEYFSKPKKEKKKHKKKKIAESGSPVAKKKSKKV